MPVCGQVEMTREFQALDPQRFQGTGFQFFPDLVYLLLLYAEKGKSAGAGKFQAGDFVFSGHSGVSFENFRGDDSAGEVRGNCVTFFVTLEDDSFFSVFQHR